MSTISIASTDAEIQGCYSVMAELRPHLVEQEFVARVRRQMQSGYWLATLEDEGRVQSVAGSRYAENLVYGKYLYVDDLVTAAASRSRGYGGELLDWLVAQAKANDCDVFHLDSGVQRFAAHRFYLLKRMDITSHHFVLKLR